MLGIPAIALLIQLAPLIGLGISAEGVIVPEIDRIVAREHEKAHQKCCKCVTKYVIITKPTNVAALRRLLAHNPRSGS